eukprot:CAMPEP_0176097250 /NCGR_PEP_ID=MMETSP0120_2-20121206/48754_1 /TAXON_ID=160619 /ORGANISM="Kryptoperidinium foliaceum, Strain CCMP 1326" /LENGTH=265 /DNA_ID=CAMNT_0017431241 /DNA_START=143 /DNA_END=938 /DNA_ORIENTATION=+
MTTYVDVEPPSEALQEDEELIEAVNEIVDKAAIAIYTDIKNDVSGVLFRLRYYLDTAFPFLENWREDPTAMGRDLKNICLVFVIYLFAFWFLSPSRRWRMDKRQQGKKRFKLSASLLTSDKRTSSLQLLRKKLATTFDKKPKRSNSFRKRPGLERSRSTSSITGMQWSRKFNFLFKGRTEEDEDDEYDDEDEEEEQESEEELFAKRWPSILQTNYASLVLPPECKRVEKPKHPPKHESDTKKPANIIRAESHEGGSDEENPDRRL